VKENHNEASGVELWRYIVMLVAKCVFSSFVVWCKRRNDEGGGVIFSASFDFYYRS
jgi:hypothetical protein